MAEKLPTEGGLSMTRQAQVTRKTRETDVEVDLNLDGAGKVDLATGIPFLDHMLHLFAAHGYFDLTVKARGDLEVDQHHTVEDIGICLGQALKKALGEKAGVRRFGSARVPMDEALAQVSLDLSNRPFLHFDVRFSPVSAALDPQLLREFWRAVAIHGGLTVHIEVPYGENTHHIMEAIFKAMGRALDRATQVEPRAQGAPSTKGML
jgi:imidazoleglycerol-phosphate dehydratase